MLVIKNKQEVILIGPNLINCKLMPVCDFSAFALIQQDSQFLGKRRHGVLMHDHHSASDRPPHFPVASRHHWTLFDKCGETTSLLLGCGSRNRAAHDAAQHQRFKSWILIFSAKLTTLCTRRWQAKDHQIQTLWNSIVLCSQMS
jgi:hypothetical protein